MKHTRFFIILSILFFPVLSAAAPENDNIPEELIKSAVMLLSNNGRCGSGFITTSGKVVTNAHVVESLCPGDSCGAIILRRAGAIGASAEQIVASGALKVERIHRALDIAVISSEQPIEGAFDFTRAEPAESEIYVLGFPGCKQLALSKGRVTAADPLRVFTTALGSYGSSGSVMFNHNKQVVGIVHQSGSMLGGVLAMIAGTQFECKGVPAASLAPLLAQPDNEAWDGSAQILLKVLLETAPLLPVWERLRLDFDLMSAMQGLAEDAASVDLPPEDILPLSLTDSDIEILARLNRPNLLTGRRALSEQLLLAYLLEMRGLHNKQLRPLNLNGLQQRLRELTVSPHYERLNEQLTAFQRSGYPGTYISGLAAFIPIAAVILLLAMAWSASLGYVFATAHGGFLRRMTVAALVGITVWPLSLLLFLLIGRQRKTSP
ncbi:MAG: trypsin-like peptidase domain-containing protein [Deltaproteobacteria bacterium]|nr:trypsin-like peptidase domain-containing protein [Deltaproteobacteria bacterium]